jgi:hypothetical protein
MLGRRSILDGRAWGQYTQQLIRHLPFADPDDEYVASVPPCARALPAAQVLRRCARTEPDRRCVALPGQWVFQPASYRLGIPRVEWLIDFDLFVATELPGPRDQPSRSRRADRARSAVPGTSPSPRRTR